MMQRFEVKLASNDVDAKTGQFSGYGSIFGNIDAYGDVIEKGAFKDTLREWEERGKLPPMLLQHGGGMFGGGAEDMLPIGKWNSMEENSKGLKVDGQLFALGTEKGQYIHEGLKSGVLDGLSIGYQVKKFVAGTKSGEPRRRIQQLDLWELSIVTFPGNDKARVTGVKSLDDPTFWRGLEGAFRSELKLSNAAAVSAVAIVKKRLREGGDNPADDARDELSEVMAAFERNARILKV